MKITTEISIEDNPQKEGDAFLDVKTYLDGNYCGRVRALSGPKKDIEDYVMGRISSQQLSVRWQIIR